MQTPKTFNSNDIRSLYLNSLTLYTHFFLQNSRLMLSCMFFALYFKYQLVSSRFSPNYTLQSSAKATLKVIEHVHYQDFKSIYQIFLQEIISESNVNDGDNESTSEISRIDTITTTTTYACRELKNYQKRSERFIDRSLTCAWEADFNFFFMWFLWKITWHIELSRNLLVMLILIQTFTVNFSLNAPYRDERLLRIILWSRPTSSGARN